ncbi:transposable element Tc1 transposase [Trichonephila clavipes]|nr:transposable element Tc1 transposase [Trichonephila clavipes]
MPDRTAGRCASRTRVRWSSTLRLNRGFITEDDTSPVCHTQVARGRQNPVDTAYDVGSVQLKSHRVAASARNANNQSVRRHLDAFTRGRIIGKLEEGRSVTSVAAEFGIAHSIVSRLWRLFQTTGTAIRGFSSGRPRGTTPADDRYIVLHARRNRRQTAGEIARHTTQATGRPISRFTVARRLHGGDESRFSLSSDSHRILIWRERGSRNIPRTSLKGTGMEVAVFPFGEAPCLVVVQTFTSSTQVQSTGPVLPYVRLFRGAMGLQFLFMDDNAPCHRTVAVEQLLESEDIERMDWPARSPDLNPIEHVWDFLGRRFAART